MLALDRGPGIADLAASLRDGHSTAGSAGQRARRARRDWRQRSTSIRNRRRGTALRLVFWAEPAERPTGIEIGRGLRRQVR